MGQKDGQDRSQRGDLHARPRVRLKLQHSNELGDAGSEAEGQDSCVCGGYGQFLLEFSGVQAGRRDEEADESGVRLRFSVWKADQGAWVAADFDGESGEVDGGACGEKCGGRGYEAVALLREVMTQRSKEVKNREADSSLRSE